ncbi:hypothetical protein PR048_001565 [Dryococelus australis]|uniref:Uncharacterized protein n=1 Tax=Dryococelus australis TaxID=614101 RepID=A0ABQ9IHQ3_9NEOP|nr:hypothetical protein PR048_001565 [Dryococelus australis]
MKGATVAELAVSLLASHQGDSGSIPGRITPDFRMWETCRTMPFVGWFSWGSPVSPTLSFRRCSVLTSITLIGSQDLDVKSSPNLFNLTHVESSQKGSDFASMQQPMEKRRRLDMRCSCGWCILATSELRAACSIMFAEKRGSYKGQTGTRSKVAITATRTAVNWHVLYWLNCRWQLDHKKELTDEQRSTMLWRHFADACGCSSRLFQLGILNYSVFNLGTKQEISVVVVAHDSAKPRTEGCRGYWDEMAQNVLPASSRGEGGDDQIIRPLPPGSSILPETRLTSVPFALPHVLQVQMTSY